MKLLYPPHRVVDNATLRLHVENIFVEEIARKANAEGWTAEVAVQQARARFERMGPYWRRRLESALAAEVRRRIGVTAKARSEASTTAPAIRARSPRRRPVAAGSSSSSGGDDPPSHPGRIDPGHEIRRAA